MMRSLLTLSKLIVGGLLCASTALAVSQVGGGKIGNSREGYRASVPEEFSEGRVFPNDDMQLNGPFIVRGALGFTRLKLNIYLLRNEFPAYQSVTDRSFFHSEMIRLGWTSNENSDPCVETFQLKAAETINVLLAWGDGKGILLSGESTGEISRALNLIEKTLSLEPGACAWK